MLINDIDTYYQFIVSLGENENHYWKEGVK